MKTIVKLEELAMFTASIFALAYLKVDWWYYLVLFLGPDIGMLGYVFGNKVGAFCYNVFHHKAIAVVLILVGFVYTSWPLQVGGLILFGHSAMDRMLGYGLKYNQGFKFTHLGTIGNKD